MDARPQGTGLLYLSAELGTRVDPIQLQGGRAAYSASSGVTSLPSVLGLGVAMDYLDAIGLPAIEAHNLARRAREAVRRRPRARAAARQRRRARRRRRRPRRC
ncbi:MAG: aminotransferase class V-fold PLP-dependent enzyme [Gemmatimonadetes bacterium]|nr:aminotransferase class V-fold PLP-dependent enzyme [Gemmatimonadota bacterium]